MPLARVTTARYPGKEGARKRPQSVKISTFQGSTSALYHWLVQLRSRSPCSHAPLLIQATLCRASGLDLWGVSGTLAQLLHAEHLCLHWSMIYKGLQGFQIRLVPLVPPCTLVPPPAAENFIYIVNQHLNTSLLLLYSRPLPHDAPGSCAGAAHLVELHDAHLRELNLIFT